jgi:glycosyltransferase involved in cell wall biosynthesis
MKLYLISQSYQENKGSFSGFVEQAARYASTLGFEVVILCGLLDGQKAHENTEYAEIIRFKTVKFVFSNVINALLLAKEVKNYFSKNKVEKEDLILANGEAAFGVKNKDFILRAGDQPILTYLKNMEIGKNEVSLFSRFFRLVHLSLLNIIEKMYYPKASAVIYSSEETRHLYEREYKTRKPYFIPHSGVKYDELRKGKKLPYEGRLLLFVSAGEERIRKGVVYLERALPEIFEKYPDVKLLHVGDKFQWNIPENYKKRIISVGRIKWSDMKDYYKSSEMMISTSLHEMFPNTIIEAMVSGLPVVTSDIQGAREYVKHIKEGYIFKRGDSEDLKKGILFMLENSKKIKKTAISLKKKAKKLDQKTYSRELFLFAKKNCSGVAYSKNLLETF